MRKFFVGGLALLCLGMCNILFAVEKNGNGAKTDNIIDKKTDSFSRDVLNRLVAGDYAFVVSKFDSTMNTSLPEDKLKRVWESIIVKYGAFKTLNTVKSVSGVSSQRQNKTVLMSCSFVKAPLDIKISFSDKMEISGLWILLAEIQKTSETPDLPIYVDKSRFIDSEVTVESGKWSLPGTLSMPAGLKKVPGVVLVHGTGPHNRDETIGPNTPFRDIAMGLASQGIAVIRYEKRTKQYPKEMQESADKITVKEETIDDALAAVSLLRKNKNIDPEKIFVLGHSLGGMLVPRIGELDPKIAGFIVMAGPTMPLEDLILQQMTRVISNDGKISQEEKLQIETLREQITRVKSWDLSSETPSKELPFYVPAGYWLDLRGYKPQETAGKLSSAFLILQGDKDFQVPVKNFNEWGKVLKSKKNVQCKLYPGLNHLFMAAESQNSTKEYNIKGFVAEDVVNDIARWINSYPGK